MFKAKSKNKEKICKNCIAFDGNNNLCRVIILHEGQKINLPVVGNDPCFFEQKIINPDTGKEETLNDVQQVKMWEEDKTVKIEYPNDFISPN